jgi:carboxyl-terminal processing protease
LYQLTIFRDSSTKDYSVTRDTITSQSVESEVLEGNIGYMRILRFGDDTSSLATKAAEEFKSKGVQKVILDLRGNGGGLLMSSKEVAGLWLNDKVIVSERTGGATTETLRSGKNPILGGVKTVVLVDGGSASASEIVAGALKDNGAATLVGEKTFGKGSVQLIEDVLSGGKLKVTVAKWYTPNGTNINKEGIKPDKEVKHTEEDTKNGNDPQKQAAIDFVNN